MNHTEMRIALRAAFSNIFSREGTISELQHLQAIASLESGYGQWWKPPGVGSFNLGAIQAGSSWNGATFEYTDTTPQPDGSSKPYVTKFRKYPTLVAGAEDLVRAVFVNMGRATVLRAANEGRTDRFSAGLYCVSSAAARTKENADVLGQFGITPTGYYQGWGKTPAERIAHHCKSVVASIRAQALELTEPLPTYVASLPEARPLLRLGAKGGLVIKLQQALVKRGAQLKPDGDFGAKTRDAVVTFQRSQRLTADGIVGEKTWALLEAA